MVTYELVKPAEKLEDAQIKVITPTVSEETYSIRRIDMLIAEIDVKMVSLQAEKDRWEGIRADILPEAEKAVGG